jgi:hypothetical protein
VRTWLLTSALTLTALLGATKALAQECQTDADCARGLICESAGMSGCPGSACAPGEECPEPPPCGPVELRACQPGPCASDADCGAGLVCYTHEDEICSGGAPCAPGSDCSTIPPETCTTTSEQICVPRYLLPCAQDIDCGEGFRCVEEQICGCSGSAPASPPDGGPVVEPEPPVCECTPSGTLACELIVTACSTAADCPDQWSCEPNPEGSCSRAADGTTSCEPADPALLCVPPYAELGRGIGASGEDNDFLPGSGAPTSSPESGSAPPPSSDGGCRLSAGRSGGGALGLALAAAVALLAQRRRRVA